MKKGLLAVLASVTLVGPVCAIENLASNKSITGDFNGDNIMDRVTVMPIEDMFYYWQGSGSGGDLAAKLISEWSMYSEYFPGSGNHDASRGNGAPPTEDVMRTSLNPGDMAFGTALMGASIAVGDFDGDGDDDLALGMPYSDVGTKILAGKVVILNGRFNFPNASYKQTITQNTTGSWGSAEDYDFFGWALASGDFNCDGYDDLAIGVPYEDMGSVRDAGVVQLFYGSSSGLVSSNYRLRESDMPGESQAAYEYFGVAVATGYFNGSDCESLAVGAKGEDINGNNRAGAVYMFYASPGDRLSYDRIEKLHQDYGGIDNHTEANDYFGSRVGAIKINGPYDNLWVEASGEDIGLCQDHNQLFYHKLIVTFDGVNENAADSHYCGLFDPGFIYNRYGYVSEFPTTWGDIAFYFPDKFSYRINDLAVQIQGSNYGIDGSTPCGSNPIWYLRDPEWLNEANAQDTAIVVPEMNNLLMGNKVVCFPDPPPGKEWSIMGGYRGLFGAGLGADEWLNLVVDDLKKIGLGTSGTFKLFGHSAGGQFVNRYLWKHAERVSRAVISAAGFYVTDDLRVAWPNGLGFYNRQQYWPSWSAPSYQNNYNPVTDKGSPASRWPEMMSTTHIILMVGEDDEGDPNECDRLDRALAWQERLNDEYSGAGVGKIEFCVHENGTHDARTMAAEASSRLLNDLTTGACVTAPDSPDRCLSRAPYPYD